MIVPPQQRFESSLERSIYVWCFHEHHSRSAVEAAARILLEAASWSSVAEDMMMRELISRNWYYGPWERTRFWDHFLKRKHHSFQTHALIRANHFDCWGCDGTETVEIFRTLKENGNWSRACWETVRRSACWHYATGLKGKDFQSYAFEELGFWSMEAESLPSRSDLKAPYWFWKRRWSHFYVPKGASYDDYCMEWDPDGTDVSAAAEVGLRIRPSKQSDDGDGWKILDDQEWEANVRESSAHPIHQTDQNGETLVAQAANDPKKRADLLAQFIEDTEDSRTTRWKLNVYFGFVDAGFLPERTEIYRRLLMASSAKDSDYQPFVHQCALQLILWWPDHPETKAFLMDTVSARSQSTPEFTGECLQALVFGWPQDEEVRQLVCDILDHGILSLSETAVKLLKICYDDEADYLPLLRDRWHRSFVFFAEYLMCAAPDLEAMWKGVDSLNSLGEAQYGFSNEAAELLVIAYGPRKDLLDALQEVARQTHNIRLQEGIAGILRYWMPISFWKRLSCLAPSVQMKMIETLNFDPQNERLMRDLMMRDESIPVRFKAAAWLCSKLPGKIRLVELQPLIFGDAAESKQLLHHWAKLHPLAVEEVLEFGQDSLFKAPCSHVTLLVSSHYFHTALGKDYLHARMLGDATDMERDSILDGLRKRACQDPDVWEQLKHLIPWIRSPWVTDTTMTPFLEAMLPFLERGDRLRWLLDLAEDVSMFEWPSSLRTVVAALSKLPGKEGYMSANAEAVVVVEWLTKRLASEQNSEARTAFAEGLVLGFFTLCPTDKRKIHPTYSAAMDALKVHYGW